MQCLLISSSRAPGYAYLEYPLTYIQQLLGPTATSIAFIPYAKVTSDHPGISAFDSYERTVKTALGDTGYSVTAIHEDSSILDRCDAIVVGGGNTFHLLQHLQRAGITDQIRRRVLHDGVPFIGWSAGANLACPAINTTNDMPIVEPTGFAALDLVPFQINPHYIETVSQQHFGETRDTRLLEFVAANQSRTVVGLPEGMVLSVDDTRVIYQGIFDTPCRLFRHGHSPTDYPPGTDLSFLLAPLTP